MQGREIDEAAIHDVVRAGFEEQFVQQIDLVHGTRGNIDETGNVAAQIDQRVKLDGPLAAPEPGQGNSLRHRSIVVVSKT